MSAIEPETTGRSAGDDTRHSARPGAKQDRTWSPADGLTLPRTPDRQAVALERDRYRLRESETELLATVGAFRVVPERELTADRGDERNGTGDRPSDGDVRSLVDQGLIETRTIMINNTPERVVVLTTEGRDLLEAHREPREERDEPDQRYYAGLVKPRELAHDAQLYRMFEIERERLEAEGARITRIVLDYELKSEYHAFVHAQRQAGVSANDARREFADTHDLPFRRGHIALPDVRIEYDSPDGDRLHRGPRARDRALLALPDEWQAGRRLPRLPRRRRAPVWGRQGRREPTRPTPSGLAWLMEQRT